MKNVVQLSHEDLLEMIILKLTGEGLALLENDFAVEFVTSADGSTSALITGAVPEKDIVREPEDEPEKPDLRAATRKALKNALGNVPLLQARLMEIVLDTLPRWSDLTKKELKRKDIQGQVNAHIITALQEWEKKGHVQYVEEIDSWRKVPKKTKKQTPAQAAMDILGGSGGVLDRSDALGQGVASDKRRR